MSLSNLSPEQRKFVAYRLSGLSVEESAKQTGITDRTGYRWMKLPAVLSALAGVTKYIEEEVAQSASEIITSKYRAALPSACDTVVSIVQDPIAPPAARLKAAQMIQDRLAPVDLSPSAETQAGPIPAELLPYLHEDEIATIEQLLARASERKMEAEQKITPLRREA